MFNRSASTTTSTSDVAGQSRPSVACRGANVILGLAMVVAVVIAASDFNARSLATGLVGPEPTPATSFPQ